MAAFQTPDAVGAVVADVGHYATKIGWAGDDTPRSYFRSTVSVEREEMKDDSDKRSRITAVQYDSYKLEGDTWRTCNPIHRHTGLLYDTNESNTSSADWYDLLPQFLEHGYKTALHKASLSDHPLLLAERSYTPPAIRQQVIECLFEEAEVPAAFLAKDAVLQCYACGRTTATVVDVGHSGTTVTPVFDGFVVEPKAIRRSPAGVMAMDEYLIQQLDDLYEKQQPKQKIRPLYQVKQRNGPKRRPSFHQYARLQVAQECRELGAGAAMNLVDAASNFQAPHKPFTLPDGTMVDVPSAVRFATADLIYGDTSRTELFEACQKELEALVKTAEEAAVDANAEEVYSPAAAAGLSKRRTKGTAAKTKSVFNNRRLQAACLDALQTLQSDQLSSDNLASMICSAAYRCDRDHQAALLANVVLGGGGTCLGPTEQAVPDVVREKMEALIHQHTAGWRVKVLTPAKSERAILTWLGGSILGSLGTFPEMWISREEYDEWGTAIVNRKCP